MFPRAVRSNLSRRLACPRRPSIRPAIRPRATVRMHTISKRHQSSVATAEEATAATATNDVPSSSPTNRGLSKPGT